MHIEQVYGASYKSSSVKITCSSGKCETIYYIRSYLLLFGERKL